MSSELNYICREKKTITKIRIVLKISNVAAKTKVVGKVMESWNLKGSKEYKPCLFPDTKIHSD